MVVRCECCVCCRVDVSARRADHSSRGVLPTVVRPSVRSRNIQKEAAQTSKGCKCRIEEEEE